MKNLQVRILMYILGLFILTIGISISVKSDLGVSPLSSLPYTMTCVWGIEMGKATIIFHCLLVLLQVILLGRKFKPINLLQVLAGIIFGYFTTFCNYLISFIPSPNNIVDQIMMALISTVFVAVGTFFYLPAKIMPLAGEGIVDTIAVVTKTEFSNIKIMFDSFLVLVSVIICFIVLHNLGSVGIGTLIAELLVGTEIGYLTKLFGKWRDKIISE